MKLTQKLLGFIHRVFDRDPERFLALRLSYLGDGMLWEVDGGFLRTFVEGGIGQNLAVDLSQFTVTELISHLAGQPGYEVLYADRSENAALSARVLLDGSGDINKSNGDYLFGYTTFLFSYFEAQSVELEAAAVQVEQALRQMNTKTAEGLWQDELGDYLNVPRLQDEADIQYGPRIVAEILRPRGNNVAMEKAITVFTGQETKVVDVTLYGFSEPLHNQEIKYNGLRKYNAAPIPLYGLFDVEYGYDLLNGADVTQFRNTLQALIGRLRDAGTHMRSLRLQASAISDAFPFTPKDGSAVQALAANFSATEALPAPAETYTSKATLAPMSDFLVAPADRNDLSISYNYKHNGIRKHNSIVAHKGGQVVAESL